MIASSSLNWTTLLDGLRATPAHLRDLLNAAAAARCAFARVGRPRGRRDHGASLRR